MIEAVATLASGKSILVVASNWGELSEQLEKYPVKKLETKTITVGEMRQGKYEKER